MRGFRSTLVLLVIFFAFLGYYLYESRRPAAPSAEQKPKAFTVEADKIEELTIKSGAGEAAKLKKGSAGWELLAPSPGPADQTEVSSITQGLASLEIQRVVDENPADLAQYGLAEPKVDVGFRATGQKSVTRLLVGDKTPTGGELYAQAPDNKRVFLVASYLDGTFNKTPFALRDKTVLKFDRDKVTAFEIARPKDAVAFTKEGSDWNLTKPLRASGDYAAVEGVIGQLQSAQMTTLVAAEANDLKQYGLDKPAVTATIVAASGRHTLEVGKPSPDGSVYARDLARPLVFTISQALVTDLEKPTSDFRRKDLFEFRPFSATRIELTRNNATQIFEKVKGAGENAQEKWQQVAPVKKDIDTSKFESALTQLSALRAQSFVDGSAPASLKNPTATVVVKFDDGKKEERVAFGKSASDVDAARTDQPGGIKLELTAFDNVMKAFDEFK